MIPWSDSIGMIPWNAPLPHLRLHFVDPVVRYSVRELPQGIQYLTIGIVSIGT